MRYHSQHPELVRLVMNENIHRGEHLKQIEGLPEGNHQVIDILRRIIDRGEAEGSFRSGIDAVTLHMNMTALSFYNVSNQFTFAHNFGVDMSSAEAVERRAHEVADILVAWVTATSVAELSLRNPSGYVGSPTAGALALSLGLTIDRNQFVPLFSGPRNGMSRHHTIA